MWHVEEIFCKLDNPTLKCVPRVNFVKLGSVITKIVLFFGLDQCFGHFWNTVFPPPGATSKKPLRCRHPSSLIPDVQQTAVQTDPCQLNILALFMIIFHYNRANQQVISSTRTGREFLHLSFFLEVLRLLFRAGLGIFTSVNSLVTVVA